MCSFLYIYCFCLARKFQPIFCSLFLQIFNSSFYLSQLQKSTEKYSEKTDFGLYLVYEPKNKLKNIHVRSCYTLSRRRSGNESGNENNDLTFRNLSCWLLMDAKRMKLVDVRKF